MKKQIIFLLVLIFLTCSSHAEIIGRNRMNLTIDNAIRIALDRNKSIQMQKSEIDYARGNRLYALSRFLPKANVNYDYTYREAVLATESLPDHRKDTRIFTDYESDNIFSVTAKEEFFDGGASIANYKQAEIELTSQKETLRATILEVEFETRRLFYGLLLAYETRRIALDLVEQAREHYERVEMLYGQGTTSRFDVLQSKVQVARLIPQLVNAENAIELTKVDIKKLLDLDISFDVHAIGKLAFRPMEINEENFLLEAYEHRPEMRLKTLGVDIDKWGIEFAKSTGLPHVSGNFAYSAKSDDVANMVNKRHDNWAIGLSTSIAIFDGFSTAAKINEARAKYAHARLDREDYMKQIEVDVESACLNMGEAEAIINAQKDSIVEAKESLRLSEVRFDTGVGINLDVFDAQVALAQIEQSLVQAIYDYIMAKADLEKVMGREFFKEE